MPSWGQLSRDGWVQDRPENFDLLLTVLAVPYLAQGAAMAVEDAAALAIAVSSNLSIEDALKAYEKVRLPRTTAISAGADNNRNIFHMPDGPGQQARDEMVKKTRGQVSNIFDMAWKYDAVEEMRKEIGTKASI